MRESPKRVESPTTYVTELVSRGHFCSALYFCRTALPCSGGYHQERGVMRLRYTVKRAQLLNTNGQMSSIWANGCMLTIVCVLSDLTPRWWREKVMVYYYHCCFSHLSLRCLFK